MRFYCGCAPGGTADLLCRIPAVVDTKTGAADVITNEAVANGVPDGRAIGLAAMAAMCVSNEDSWTDCDRFIERMPKR